VLNRYNSVMHGPILFKVDTVRMMH